MSKFVIIVNGGLWGGGKVFDMEGVKKVFKDVGVEEWKIMGEDEEEVMEFDEGIDLLREMGDMGESVEVYNEELCVMGDDCCNLSICELEF